MPAPSVICGLVSALTSSSPSAAHSGPHAASDAAASAPRWKLPPERALIGGIQWVICAVNIGMAVQAVARERDALARTGAAGPGHASHVAAVTGRLVALLAQEGPAR